MLKKQLGHISDIISTLALANCLKLDEVIDYYHKITIANSEHQPPYIF